MFQGVTSRRLEAVSKLRAGRLLFLGQTSWLGNPLAWGVLEAWQLPYVPSWPLQAFPGLWARGQLPRPQG